MGCIASSICRDSSAKAGDHERSAGRDPLIGHAGAPGTGGARQRSPCQRDVNERSRSSPSLGKALEQHFRPKAHAAQTAACAAVL
jgi:hypothetical protein